MWPIKKAFQFLSKEESEHVMECVRQSEEGTSGEIRICIESNCSYMNPLERAEELFFQLKMNNTENRNAVLIYVAYEDHDFALFGDRAVFEKAHKEFWEAESKKLASAFYLKEYVQGLTTCIQHIGAMLKTLFPHHGEKKNELPDEIVFGK